MQKSKRSMLYISICLGCLFFLGAYLASWDTTVVWSSVGAIIATWLICLRIIKKSANQGE
jgi:hypothetical protein